MAAVFGASSLGVSYLGLWLSLDAVNPLAGLLSGVFILVIAVAAAEPVRRRCYEATVVAHLLWPAVVALACVHTEGSPAAALPVVLPGALLLALDFLIMAADALLRPVRVLATGILSDRPYEEKWHRTVYVVASKAGRWAWVDRVWPFTYLPGQYIFLVVPEVRGAGRSRVLCGSPACCPTILLRLLYVTLISAAAASLPRCLSSRTPSRSAARPTPCYPGASRCTPSVSPRASGATRCCSES